MVNTYKLEESKNYSDSLFRKSFWISTWGSIITNVNWALLVENILLIVGSTNDIWRLSQVWWVVVKIHGECFKGCAGPVKMLGSSKTCMKVLQIFCIPTVLQHLINFFFLKISVVRISPASNCWTSRRHQMESEASHNWIHAASSWSAWSRVFRWEVKHTVHDMARWSWYVL